MTIDRDPYENSSAANIDFALDHLRQVIEARLHISLAALSNGRHEVELPALSIYDDDSAFGDFVKARQPTFEEYVVLLLALAPHVRPDFLDKVIRAALPDSGDFPELGGMRDKESRRFLPTGETAFFLLAGDNLAERFAVQRIFTADHWFAREGVLRLERAREGEPFWSGRLLLNTDFIELFTLGRLSNPSFSAEFPARAISTELDWSDLVLEGEVIEQIEELKRWIEHNDTLMNAWGMRHKLRPGYRVLFHGPPGTGKTLTATLLGKHTGREVFRIDLSTVVSKYIGETEKNLANLFDKALHKHWILFFDEADALFGKRTDVKDAHDRYANQEVSYLLQRVEEFDGLVILATNFKANLDEAFLRRFNAIVRFPFPNEAERKALWQKLLPPGATWDIEIDLPGVLATYELAGGNIVNVVQHASLAAIARGSNEIRLEDALKGIQREIEKEGKIFKLMPRISSATLSA